MLESQNIPSNVEITTTMFIAHRSTGGRTPRRWFTTKVVEEFAPMIGERKKLHTGKRMQRFTKTMVL